jgi:MoaA/NifB/PqqE/SkfB family radical SAM enzyme
VVPFTRIEIGTGGLPVCTRCGVATLSRARTPAEVCEEIRASAAAWSGGSGPNVWLAGAEAFAHPDLPALIDCAVSAGAVRVKLTTGGAALAVGQNAAGSLDAGVRHVEVVLLAGSPALHDALAGHSAAFDDALRGVAALHSAAEQAAAVISITGRIPVCPHNIESVPELVALFARSGADAVIAEVTPGVASRVPQGWVAAVADTGVVNSVWVTFSGVDTVQHGVSAIHARAPWDTVPAGIS